MLPLVRDTQDVRLYPKWEDVRCCCAIWRQDLLRQRACYLATYHIVAQVFNVYALRMAAVFLISQATLWLRTGVMPRWLALPTYGVALVLLFIVSQSTWVVLIFPAWVLIVSVYILIVHLTQSGAARHEAEEGRAQDVSPAWVGCRRAIPLRPVGFAMRHTGHGQPSPTKPGVFLHYRC